jgi:hypothetical protein
MAIKTVTRRITLSPADPERMARTMADMLKVMQQNDIFEFSYKYKKKFPSKDTRVHVFVMRLPRNKVRAMKAKAVNAA